MAADGDECIMTDSPPAPEQRQASPEADAAAGSSSADGQFLIVARVLRAHGTQGELACEIITEFPQRFRQTKRVFLVPPRGPGRMEPLDGVAPQEHVVSQARLAQHRGFPEVILKLDTLSDRDAAEALRGWLVQVPENESWRLPRGRFYWHQIIGLTVITTDGERIGTVREILETGANDVYVVRAASGGERLIPAVKEIVREIAPERGEIVVALIPGM